MRKLVLVALLCLSPSLAFANFTVLENEATEGGKEYSCQFGHAKKGGLVCAAEAKKFYDAAAANKEEREAKLAVECNNGFEFFDREAEWDWNDGKLIFEGHRKGTEVHLIIFKEHDLARDHGDKALLVIERGGQEVKLFGRCEQENERPKLD